MTLQIVTLNVSTNNPPAPSALLKSGAFISQGGTKLAANTLQPLYTSADLAGISFTPVQIASLTWLAGVVTVVTSSAHGLSNNSQVTIAGCTPAGYNVTNVTATVTNTTTFSYPLANNPGAETALGTVTTYAATELAQMNTSFWAQGSTTPVYVLELGSGSSSAGVTALTTWITQNPNTIFSFLVPREWDAEPTFKTMASNYTSPSSLIKFFVTSTLSTYSAWGLTYTNVFLMVEAPGVPSTEFSAAAPFYDTLNWTPGSTTQVPPLCFNFEYGVTQYPTKGNATTLSSLKAANVNYLTSAAEGGLSNTMLVWGHMQDGNPFNYWYTVAWSLINLDLDISNEVINGSNNTINPLYYNQAGINRLQNRAAKTLRNGVSYGLILGQVIVTQLDPTTFAANVANGLYAGNAVINAVPFSTYTAANPSDYSLGKYAGLQAAITPLRGFEQIVFNLNVTQFVA